jgi:hypothetical protein
VCQNIFNANAEFTEYGYSSGILVETDFLRVHTGTYKTMAITIVTAIGTSNVTGFRCPSTCFIVSIF